MHDSTEPTTPALAPRPCALAACGVIFTPRINNPGQRYHTPECRKKGQLIEAKAKRDADPAAFHAEQAAYREKNRERINAEARKRYAKPEINEQERLRRSTPEAKARQAEKNKEFKRLHPEIVKKHARTRYLRHKDRLNARSKEWYAERNARLAEAERVLAMNQPKKRGRTPEPEESKTYFQIGEAVEKLIPADQKNDRSAIIAARLAVAGRSHFERDVVAQYHGAFRRWRKKNSNPKPL